MDERAGEESNGPRAGAAATSDPECVFCRIIAGEIPAEVVAEDERFLAFRDLHPLAPVHVLVIPRTHVASLDDIAGLGGDAKASMLEFIASTARAEGVVNDGYRVITNVGAHAGQEVRHLHWHLIGGAQLGGMV
jgi:histidine triad (HIT) family protein